MPKSELWYYNGVMAIIRGVRPDEAVEVAQTMYNAGIRVIEVPLNSPEPFISIGRIIEALGDKMLVGAGTVLDVDSVRLLKDVGGEYVVSPNMSPQVIDATKQACMLSYPGVMTVTECITALEAGADGLKLFPANVIGMDFIGAAKVVLPRKVPMIAVGGVNEHTIEDWKSAGADGFALGSAIYKPGMALDEIRQRCEVVIAKLS